MMCLICYKLCMKRLRQHLKLTIGNLIINSLFSIVSGPVKTILSVFFLIGFLYCSSYTSCFSVFLWNQLSRCVLSNVDFAKVQRKLRPLVRVRALSLKRFEKWVFTINIFRCDVNISKLLRKVIFLAPVAEHWN